MMATMQPSAITSFYAMPRLNAPIALFRGRVDLVGEAATERHRGGIVLEWLPSPAVSVWAPGGSVGPRAQRDHGTGLRRDRAAHTGRSRTRAAQDGAGRITNRWDLVPDGEEAAEL